MSFSEERDGTMAIENVQWTFLAMERDGARANDKTVILL